MPSTQNKGYTVPSTGSESGTWGDDLNANFQGIVDNNLGGIVTKSVAGSNITLSSTESQMLIVRLTGAQSADIQLTTSCIGMFFVENLTTNAFAITIVNDQIGTSVVVPKGRCTVISDATNGCRIAGTDSFPTGTRMTFQQTLAPTGWTKDASSTDFTFRGTSGTAGTGGSVNFSVAFASQTPTGTISGTALTVDQIPLHGHPSFQSAFNGGDAGFPTGGLLTEIANTYLAAPYTGTPNATAGQQIGGTGGGQSHTHTFTGNAINLTVKYADLIIAVKD